MPWAVNLESWDLLLERSGVIILQWKNHISPTQTTSKPVNQLRIMKIILDNFFVEWWFFALRQFHLNLRTTYLSGLTWQSRRCLGSSMVPCLWWTRHREWMNERIRKDSVSSKYSKVISKLKNPENWKFWHFFGTGNPKAFCHSVFEDQWNESIFLGGKSKIRFGGWMSWGGMDERWATEDVAWDFAPWDHKDDSFWPGRTWEKPGFLEAFDGDHLWHIQNSK